MEKLNLGLVPIWLKKLLEGTSISNKMISIEISKNKQLKKTIKKLEKDLEELKINRGRHYKYKKDKLKTLIKSKKN